MTKPRSNKLFSHDASSVLSSIKLQLKAAQNKYAGHTKEHKECVEYTSAIQRAIQAVAKWQERGKKDYFEHCDGDYRSFVELARAIQIITFKDEKSLEIAKKIHSETEEKNSSHETPDYIESAIRLSKLTHELADCIILRDPKKVKEYKQILTDAIGMEEHKNRWKKVLAAVAGAVLAAAMFVRGGGDNKEQTTPNAGNDNPPPAMVDPQVEKAALNENDRRQDAPDPTNPKEAAQSSNDEKETAASKADEIKPKRNVTPSQNSRAR